MLFVNDVVGSSALRGQTLIQPPPRRRYRRVLIAQSQHQLDGKGGNMGGGQCFA